jgi:hypothetical protein
MIDLAELTVIARVDGAGIFLVGCILFGVLMMRLMAGQRDRDRIEKYLRDRGCEPLEVRWFPLARAALGERNDRVYQVRYRDTTGLEREATCKTSLMGGVFLSEDVQPQPVSRARRLPNYELEALRKENQLLKEEIERLQRKKT